jgi:hypothetical protein
MNPMIANSRTIPPTHAAACAKCTKNSLIC